MLIKCKYGQYNEKNKAYFITSVKKHHYKCQKYKHMVN